MKHFIMMIHLLFWMQLYSMGQYRLQPFALPKYQHIVPLQLSPLRLFTVTAANSGASGNCSTNCSVILPLTALQLEGNRQNDQQVTLQWKTKYETASHGFEIERSLGDAIHFATVASVAASMNTAVEKRYATTDANTYSGTSFYRIRQVDLNGNFAYSNTILAKGYDTKGAVWVSPNPASSIALLTCYTARSGTATVQVLTAHGQPVYQTIWPVASGSNSLRLPVSTFPPGTYYVQFVWPDGRRNELKLSKQ